MDDKTGVDVRQMWMIRQVWYISGGEGAIDAIGVEDKADATFFGMCCIFWQERLSREVAGVTSALEVFATHQTGVDIDPEEGGERGDRAGGHMGDKEEHIKMTYRVGGHMADKEEQIKMTQEEEEEKDQKQEG